ncbi:MAG: phosphatase PAP2 family protein [Gemmatimonadetes bacterium]|nr:phosphatase PAP2 family protein [Gemmatimonadota bacterium]MCH8144828.1 phosphatase PAP2 family protein [Gemmatimonadota bacterium]
MPWHKAACGWAIFLLLTSLAPPQPAAAQGSEEPTLGVRDLVFFGAAAGMYLAPGLLGIDGRQVDCGPCDSGSVPFFDRWAIAEPRSFWSHASTGLLGAIAAVTWWDLAKHDPAGRTKILASAESAAVAAGVTVLVQEVIGRDRPVFHTDAASGINPDDVRPSFPSGHSAIAFALATSYVLSRAAPSGTARVGAIVAAAAVAVLRVASARHFPSDVVGGAAVGVGSAVLVHSIRF